MVDISYREASKIKVLEAPRLAPGVCAVCGSSNNEDRQYMDIGIDIEFYGVVYFCTFCFQEAANILGCLTKEQTDKLEAELNTAKQTIINFRNKEAALDDAIDKLRSTRLFNSDPLHDSIHATPDVIEEGSSNPTGTSKSNRSKSKANSSATEQRSDDLSSFGIDSDLL